VPLVRDPEELASLLQVLSTEERARAGRFHFQQDRDAFTAARGTLRRLLGSYLDRQPEDLRFVLGPHGKPALLPGTPEAALRFNVSHSGELALIACAWNREVGVDVEKHRPGFAGEAIARRFFSAVEVTSLMALPEAQREAAFFACWSRKEAYIKARGRGLSLSLASFDVSLAPGEPAALLASRDDPREEGRWSLRALDVVDGYSAAVVVEGKGWRLRCLDRA
jgi:4'-phosphopantetheinyl transferase